MQTTMAAVPATDATAPDERRPPLVAEFHALVPPSGDPRAARALARSLRELVESAPHGMVVDIAQPAPNGDLFPLGLNLWPSPEVLRDHVLRSGPTLRRWRLESGRGTPVPQRVLWWTAQVPDLAEARRRLESLRRHGPGPAAFTLRSPHPAPRRRPQ